MGCPSGLLRLTDGTSLSVALPIAWDVPYVPYSGKWDVPRCPTADRWDIPPVAHSAGWWDVLSVPYSGKWDVPTADRWDILFYNTAHCV